MPRPEAALIHFSLKVTPTMQKRCQTPPPLERTAFQLSPPPPPSAKRRKLTFHRTTNDVPPFLPLDQSFSSDCRAQSQSPQSVLDIMESHRRVFEIIQPRRSVLNIMLQLDRRLNLNSSADSQPHPTLFADTPSGRVPAPMSRSSTVVIKPTPRRLREAENNPVGRQT
mmetsp:Transcript_8924/g.15499  ORF Transcript_8924/g.15499 Transcript_8924/m.15499 type:complete len:168 (+) Transcript_8924:29-532(+)